MAANLLRLPQKSAPAPPFPCSNKHLFLTFSVPFPKQASLLLHLQKLSCPLSATFCSLSSNRELPSSSTSYKPPSSREEAISQVKLCLSTTLQKPLNNAVPLPTIRKLKKQRQPRYRVELPVVDDSPDSLTQLAYDVFSDLPIRKRGSKSKPSILILWSSPALAESARRYFQLAGSSNSVANSNLGSIDSESLSSADLAVFLAPEKSHLAGTKTVTEDLYPRPVVLFNPKWGFEEEKDFGVGMESFFGSFEVVYSFMGLEVRGILSKRKGVMMKCVKDGVLSGEGWVVMVEEEGSKGELKMVSRFKRRPSIPEVESVLYNLMAMNSPVTKSVKLFSNLVANVTGKKAKK